MKANGDTVSAISKSRGSFYKFLKPGALAQLRNSKITARFQKHDLQSQISLCDLLLPDATASSSPTETDAPNQTDRMPCFSLRIANRPRCLHRKKLVAVSPRFVEAEH